MQQSNFFTINWVNIQGALISGLLMALVATGGYIIGVGDIFKLNAHALVNTGVMAGLTAVVSLLKSLLTNSQGVFLGIAQVH